MYHHQSQPQGPPSFPNAPRPVHNQQTNQQHNSPASNMRSGFPFPRHTQLPDELESALAVRGGRDTDHRLTYHTNQPHQHQGKGPVSAVSQHGGYSSSPIALTSDNQAGQQRADWSSFQPPNKLFTNPPSGVSHHSQLQGHHQQSQTNQTGTTIPSWASSNLSSSQAQQPHSVGAHGQSLYTPENAGSILASFGLSNEDLEVLSHYPDDQLTPDTLPFILRDIQINKSDNKNTVARNIHNKLLSPTNDSQLTASCSPEVPSLLTVTKTAGQVIDYGHASRAKESTTTKTFKREKLSSDRKVELYPSSSSASTPKVEKAEKRQVRLVHVESSKHGDRDYRRTSSDHHKRSLSPSIEGPPSKSRIVDKDYRHNGSKPRFSTESRRELSSRHSSSSSSGTAAHITSKKLPSSALISDFSGTCPKVFPHSCTLCHIACDHEKDWIDHINTVNHTAACRDLRNKYPEWKPDRKSPPHSKSRSDPPSYRLYGRSYSPYDHHLHFAGGSSYHSGLKRPYGDRKQSSDTSWKASYPKADQNSKHGPSHSSTKADKKSAKPGIKTTKTANSKADEPSTKSPPAKKKNASTPASSDSSVADRLVYLTGIPNQATEQEVTKLVASYGKINNVILMPCSEEESEKGDGLKASVCMVKAADAQALANSANIKIGEQLITASLAKKFEPVQGSVSCISNPTSSPDKGPDRKDSEGDANLNTSEKKGLVLITGLPDRDCSESDIVKLIQPFGNPNDIILASSVRKVLVSVPDVETAQEVVKVHTSTPAKMKDCELKMMNIQQHVGIDTPVALYNLLMKSMDPLENSVPVGWSSLLVISNVPNTPFAFSDVRQLVARFGTVVKSLELNNMVICQMATAAMAMSVYKRFQRFPCIIQANPLLFSRKPDPKASMQTQVRSPNLHSPEEILANDDGKTSAAYQEERASEDNSVLKKIEQEPQLLNDPEKVISHDEVVAKNGNNIVTNSNIVPDSAKEADRPLKTHKEEISAIEADMKADEEMLAVEADKKTNEEMPAIEANKKMDKEMPAVKADMKTDEDMPAIEADLKTDEMPAIEVDLKTDGEMPAIEADLKTDEMPAIEADLKTDKEMPASEADIKTNEEVPAIEADIKTNEDIPALETDMKTEEMPAIETDTKTDKEMSVIEAGIATDKVTSTIDTVMQTTINAAESEEAPSTDTAISVFTEDTEEVGDAGGHPYKVASAADGDQVHLEAKREKADDETKEAGREKADDETKEPEKSHIEAALKTQERERIEREAKKEKEAREKNRREKERRLREKEQRARWDREQEERTMRDRRERERRDRRREHGDWSLGRRSSWRFETYKTSYMDEPTTSNQPDAEIPEMGMDEDFDSFPLNMSDFVTVDEVGDVADFPHSPPPLAAPEKTTEQEQNPPACVPQCTPEDTPLEISKGMLLSQPVKSDDPVTNCQHELVKPDDPITDTQHQPVKPDNPITDTQHQTMEPDNPITDTQHQTMEPDDPITDTQHHTMEPDDPITDTRHQTMEPDHPITDTRHHTMEPDDPITDTRHQTMEPDHPITDSQPLTMTSDDAITDCKDPPTSSAETLASLSAGVMETAASPTEVRQEFSPFDQNLVPSCQPGECETDGPTTETGMTAGSKAAEEKEDKTASLDHSSGKETGSIMLDKEEKMQNTEDKGTSIPSGRNGMPENTTITEDRSEKKQLTIKTPTPPDNTLKFDPTNPVGMEFLAPKTGFFCKVCNRFFSGNRDAQITHCKTLRHFENMQKYYEETANMTVKPS
ncbi:zinc finger protein 638-like isoform X2 [Dunckerocampus dactyliophorus]|uniref:zinc finger protein 638-like isoform X2 n=1 Tax=Dunckerocampus dactyliophorus TaxID=161453 RepID=UPI0024070A1F|nr:zinc finger protein 638-like isoform X2 [Dunckerocampus dactyliophorus]